MLTGNDVTCVISSVIKHGLVTPSMPCRGSIPMLWLLGVATSPHGVKKMPEHEREIKTLAEIAGMRDRMEARREQRKRREFLKIAAEQDRLGDKPVRQIAPPLHPPPHAHHTHTKFHFKRLPSMKCMSSARGESSSRSRRSRTGWTTVRCVR